MKKELFDTLISRKKRKKIPSSVGFEPPTSRFVPYCLNN